MRHFILTFLFFQLSLNLFSQDYIDQPDCFDSLQTEPKLPEYQIENKLLVGKIKVIVEKTHLPVNQSSSFDETKFSSLHSKEFDLNNLVIEEKESLCMDVSSCERKKNYTYAPNGKIIKCEQTYGHTPSETTIYKYNASDNLIEVYSFINGDWEQSQKIIKLKYDNKGKLTEQKDSSKGGKVNICLRINKYDSLGNLIQYDQYSNKEIESRFVQSNKGVEKAKYDFREGNPFTFKDTIFLDNKNDFCLYEFEYNYDVAGKNDSDTIFYISSISGYKYDKKRNLIKKYMMNDSVSTNFDFHTIAPEEEYIYNSKSNIVEVKYFNSKNFATATREYNYKKNKLATRIFYETVNNKKIASSITKFKYDKKGSIISIIEKGGIVPYLRTEKYEYSYDRNGNWTRKIKFIDDKCVEIKTRQITYWE